MERLRQGALQIDFGSYSFVIRSDFSIVGEAIESLYGDFESRPLDDFVDYEISTSRRPLLDRFNKSVTLLLNGHPLYGRFTDRQLVAYLEWGLNWCIWNHTVDQLTLHSAVLERESHALFLVGESGAGKSTLCATLALNGWRLLSDELGLINLDSHEVHGLARPIALKNDAINLIKGNWPDVTFGPTSLDTPKGTVAHMRPPTDSVARVRESAQPRWICFPRWRPEPGPPHVEERDPGQSLMHLAHQSFNYRMLGETGFRVLVALTRACRCFEFHYHNLDDAIAFFETLPDE